MIVRVEISIDKLSRLEVCDLLLEAADQYDKTSYSILKDSAGNTVGAFWVEPGMVMLNHEGCSCAAPPPQPPSRRCKVHGEQAHQ
jgi:hypothetical protein